MNRKLGPNCSTPQALANAYMQVINAYNLNALKIVKQTRPSVRTIITFGTTKAGPNSWGQRLISRAAQLRANVDVFTIMPFDFGGTNMFQDTVNATEGLKNRLKAAFG